MFVIGQIWRGEDGLPQPGRIRQNAQRCHRTQGLRPHLSRHSHLVALVSMRINIVK